MSRNEVTIIGAGLSGLTAALCLARSGVRVTILCGGTRVGGRVRTDRHESDSGVFLLDRGFQVYLTAYDEASRTLDHDALDLKAFYPGSLVRLGSGFHRVADPFRRPLDAARLFTSPIASMTDKVRLGLLDQRIKRSSIDDIWTRPERTTLEALTEAGFGERAIERFFRPFFGGVFFDRSLATSSRMFEFTYKHFATGDTVLPSAGMGAIPQQLADRLAELPGVEIRLDSAVARVDPSTGELITADAERIHPERVLVATDAHAAAGLFGEPSGVPFNETATVYYDADPESVGALGGESILVLDGDGTGPVNHLAVPSLTAPSYAPSGRALVSCNVVDAAALERHASDHELDQAIRAQMTGWFGTGVAGWKRLATYRIRHALPRRVPGELGIDMRAPRFERSGRVFVTGDHLTHGSIEGAIIAGRCAAEAMLASGSAAG